MGVSGLGRGVPTPPVNGVGPIAGHSFSHLEEVLERKHVVHELDASALRHLFRGGVVDAVNRRVDAAAHENTRHRVNPVGVVAFALAVESKCSAATGHPTEGTVLERSVRPDVCRCADEHFRVTRRLLCVAHEARVTPALRPHVDGCASVRTERPAHAIGDLDRVLGPPVGSRIIDG